MDLARILSPSDASFYDVEDETPPPAKRRQTTTPPAPALPHAVLRAIFSSLVSNHTFEGIAVAPHVELPNDLRALACASKEWNALARDVTAEHALSQLCGSVVDLCRSEMLELRRRVTLQRKYLRSLTLEDPAPYGTVGDDHWEAVLSHVPRLQELHLNTFRQASYPQLAEILRAASRQCVEVHDLMLPSVGRTEWSRFRPRQDLLDELREALYGALAMWSKHGVCGGVRYLMVDMHHDVTDVASACDYVNKILTLCPAMERNCGFLLSGKGLISNGTAEQWLLNVPTWTRFCASQTNLTTFEWVPVPFATVFFKIFGQFPKLKLKRMHIIPALNWDWATHLRGLDAATGSALKESGFAGTAVGIHEALRACPSLEDLEVRWAYTVGNGEDLESHPTTVSGIEVPTTKMMNPEIFGDDFCEALATFCPRLDTFTLHADDDKNTSNRPIRSFTDRGFRSLATMSWLNEVTIDAAAVTGVGLYSLVVEHNATECSMDRRYYIWVGEQFAGTPDHSFYQASQDFLQRILDCEGKLPCEDRNVTLQLRNRSAASIDRIWSAQYITETKAMIKQVQEKHPTAEVTLSTVDYDEGSCARIEELIFTIGPKLISVSLYDAEEQIDEIIYNRIPESDDELTEAVQSLEASDEHQTLVLRRAMQRLVNAHVGEDDPVFHTMQLLMDVRERVGEDDDDDDDDDDEEGSDEDSDDDDDEEDEDE